MDWRKFLKLPEQVRRLGVGAEVDLAASVTLSEEARAGRLGRRGVIDRPWRGAGGWRLRHLGDLAARIRRRRLPTLETCPRRAELR